MPQFPPFQLLNDKTEQSQKDGVEKTLQMFKNQLADEDIIRVLVDGTPGYGHQAGSINLVRRLVNTPDSLWQGFDYTGTVEIYYYKLDDEDQTLNKILTLLPELNGQTTGALQKATIKIFDGFEHSPTDWVNIGFSGGWDTVMETGLTKELMVKYLLILQPFNYSFSVLSPDDPYYPGNVLKYYDLKTSKDAYINLDKARPTAPFLIQDRAYFIAIQEPSEADWAYFQSGSFSVDIQKKVAAMQYFTSSEVLGKTALTPVYGINYPKESEFADPMHYRIFLEMATLRTALESTKLLPPLIINFGNYQPGDNIIVQFPNIKRLLEGGQTISEQAAYILTLVDNPIPTAQATWLTRKAQWEARRNSILFDGVDIQYLLVDFLQDDIAPQELVAWLTGAPKRVLFIQMGFVPPMVFNYVFSQAKLPSVFEGANTASMALNTGNPYFYINRVSGVGNKVVYPTGLINSQNIIKPVEKLQAIADQMQMQIDDWPSNSTKAPTAQMSSFIEYIQSPFNIYTPYFGSIQEFYSEPPTGATYNINGKLNVGLSLLIPLITMIQQSTSLVSETKEAALLTNTTDTNPLETLYASLQAAAESGQVDLLNDIFKQGNIHDFYTDLLASYGNGLVITNPVVTKQEDSTGAIEQVSLTGNTNAFGDETAANFDFTTLFETINSQGKFTAILPWNLDDIPWIVFEDPAVQVSVSEGDIPPSSAIEGKVKGTDIELSMLFPVRDNRIVVKGEFEDLKTINDFFSIAGGIDLLQYVPGPLQTFGGLGVKYMEFAYDTTQFSIDYMLLNIQTEQSWSFFNSLQLEDITIDIIVNQPGDLQNRATEASFGGKVRIGTSEDDSRIEVGATVPQLKLVGQLYDPVLPINNLIQVFWPGLSPGWPGGQEPKITQLCFSYEMNSGAYDLLLQLELNWPITVLGTTLFEIKEVGMSMNGTQASPTGSLNGSLVILPDGANIGLKLIATYLGTNMGWRFEALQTSGVVSISDLLKEYLDWDTDLEINIDGLGITIETGTNYWEFTAKTAGPWEIPFLDLSVEGNALLGYGKEKENSEPGKYGEINAEIIWNNIDLIVFYNFNPTYTAYGITWGLLSGKIEEKTISGKVHQIGTLAFTQSTTIGSMVETMVSWATGSQFSLGAPWNVLDDIPINGLSLVYDFTDEKVAFDIAIGPINLGFAKIESISVSYNSNQPNPEDNGVIVNLKGSFLWQSDPSKPLAWDAAKPETTPTPSGQGNKYLDLRLLALGQHVTIEDLTQVDKVQDAIALMEKLPDTKPDQLPAVKLDPNSSWLIGMDFGVLKIEAKKDDNGKAVPTTDEGNYVLNLQTVFNDPNLYALRIALAGDAAKVFKGLDFQIMYRKISDSVGVYQAEIKLPDKMRQINVGQFKIVLPVFGIEIYTNGDFQVDLGFPWNQDFSRSFTLYTFIYIPAPIPVMGSVGLYFGKLSSATTSKVPAATNGTFNPVLVFGIGVQFGIGYDFSVGILSAGFSLTAVAILEGVLAKWNPYQLTDGTADDQSQLETSYYFAFQGTVGVIGKLYGTIDFAIIKASVNIDIRVLAQISFAPYTPIEISIIASVDASLSVKINLGLFKITIHLSFSAKIQESVKLPAVGGSPPWKVDTAASSTSLALRRKQKRAFIAPKPLNLKSKRTAPIGCNHH